jgi:hypothetical protein
MASDKGRTVSFSFDNPEELDSFKQYAKGRGLTLPQFIKFAAYQYRERYPGIKREKAKKGPKVKLDDKAP